MKVKFHLYFVTWHVQIILHHEPYSGRDIHSVKEDLKYIMKQYGHHDALFRFKEKGNAPVIFVYDPYHTTAAGEDLNFNYSWPVVEWSKLLRPNGEISIRGTDHDFVMISLLVEKHRDEVTFNPSKTSIWHVTGADDRRRIWWVLHLFCDWRVYIRIYNQQLEFHRGIFSEKQQNFHT